MATTTLIYIAVFLTVLLIMGKVIGNYLARLIEGDLPHWVTKTEQVIWRSCGFKPAGKAIQPMSWYHYMFALLIFNSMGALLLLVILLNQGYLPLNPQFAPNMSWDLALNTTISFITNTNWQAYSGETAVSYLSQMMGLTVQNFLSATTGIAVAFVLIRALTQSSCHSIGNAWVDIGRITLYLLLPLAIIWSLLFVGQGVIQNFHPALLSQGLENQQWLPILYVLLAVFIAGLMVGRAPEYLGKKIGVAEMKWVAVAILISPAITLLGTTLALFSQVGREAILNPGPHGFSEVLYAFTSAANNNGSAFAGLNANSVFYNLLLGITMLVGRFGVMLPVLAIAGSLAIKKRQAESLATLSTTSPLFIFLLFLTVIMIGALTFVPALALGPIAEHLQLLWAK